MTLCIVTGTNRGIGLELCRQLCEQGKKVVALCRNASDALKQLQHRGLVIEEGIDVSTDEVVDILRERLKDQVIDLLINNAGILRAEQLGHLDFASMRTQFEVNSLGPLRVTEALVPMMGPGSKVVIITSRMGSLADNTSGSRYGYRMSKAAVNMAGISLSHDLRARDIAVGLLHPGFVKTEMTGGNGLIEAHEAAAGLLQRIEELDMSTSGSFHHMNGDELPW